MAVERRLSLPRAFIGVQNIAPFPSIRSFAASVLNFIQVYRSSVHFQTGMASAVIQGQETEGKLSPDRLSGTWNSARLGTGFFVSRMLFAQDCSAGEKARLLTSLSNDAKCPA